MKISTVVSNLQRPPFESKTQSINCLSHKLTAVGYSIRPQYQPLHQYTMVQVYV